MFRRVLEEQVEDVLRLRSRFGLPVVWAGDFNCSVLRSPYTGSPARRGLLLDALARLELVVWNAEAAHAIEGLPTIDLICGPRSWKVAGQGQIDPVRDGVTMSDHAGYWVEC